MSKPRIRVLIVDDSALIRKLLTAMLKRAPEIDVVGAAPDPMVARDMIRELKPDVITLDVEMPKMDGIAFLEKIMTLRPTPVIMVSSLTQRGAQVTFQALELGAVDFVPKPTVDLEANMGSLANELIAKVTMAANTKVRALNPSAAGKRSAPVSFDTTETLIAIGASTGGVELLTRMIRRFPPNAPATVITQHMPPNFTKNFADRLNKICAVRVKEAQDGRRIVPGQVVIAPGDSHLKIVRHGADYVCRLDRGGTRVSGHCPSVDVMFESVAKSCKARAIGVILTGMGKDGARGLLDMREAGAQTIGQDETSSLVYGMPKAAFELGAVMQQLPDSKIVDQLMSIASKSSRVVRI